jgi:hypothetical protein
MLQSLDRLAEIGSIASLGRMEEGGTKGKRITKRASNKLPAKSKILAGCYIDFEGFAGNEYQMSPPPVLIGIYRDGEFKQVVFTEKYRWAAKQAGVDHEVSFHADRTTLLKELAASVSASKPLFGYTEHELAVIEKLLGHKITKRYRNARAIASRWFNKHGDLYQKPKTFALVDVAMSLGVTLDAKLPKGGVTSRLRSVGNYSSSKRKWESAPPSVRREWQEVLEHNRFDVMSMLEILSFMRRERGE